MQSSPSKKTTLHDVNEPFTATNKLLKRVHDIANEKIVLKGGEAHHWFWLMRALCYATADKKEFGNALAIAARNYYRNDSPSREAITATARALTNICAEIIADAQKARAAQEGKENHANNDQSH